MTPPVSAVDHLLADRYQLTARLASGGMGEVWRAQDLLLDRTVAVKTLRADLADDPDFRSRFRAEARHAAGLTHPGIATVYDFGELPDRAWLVMELVDGEPLSTLLQREGTLPVDRTLDVLAQTASALGAAHANGVVHRDVKPGNLMVTADGTVKVTDFGIASAAGTTTVTRTGQIVGTAGYLSPEQASGGSATPASDLYALGVVAYECLAGRRPFVADTPVAVLFAHLHTPPPALPPAVPPAVCALVERLLAKDPDDRPASALDLLQELRAVRSSAPAADPAPRTLALPVRTDDPAQRTTTRVPTGPAGPARPPRPHQRAVPLVEAPTTGGPTSRRAQRWAVRATALLLGLLAVVLGLRGQLGEAQGGEGQGGDAATRVPDVAAGTPVAEALAALERADLTAEQQRRTSATTPAGQVLSLRPAAGTRVDAGTQVVLVVSSGPPAAEQPAADADADAGTGTGTGQQAPEPQAPAAPAPDAQAPDAQAPAGQAPAPQAPVDEDAAEQAEEQAEEQPDKAAEKAAQDADKAAEDADKAAEKADEDGGQGDGGEGRGKDEP